MLDIQYRDVSTHYPRLIRRVEASLGDLRASGANKTAARADLVSVIAACAEHLYDRRYLLGVSAKSGLPVTFAFYFRAGAWCYDIVGPTGRYCSSSWSEETSESAAWERCQSHFKDYCETWSTPIAV